MADKPLGYNPFTEAPSSNEPFGRSLADPTRPVSLTMADRLLLSQAPKDGTRMTVRAYDVLSTKFPVLNRLPSWVKDKLPDHMYVEYNDGKERYIYRGGPQDGKLIGSDLRPSRLAAQVNQERNSPDFGAGGRVIYQATLPGRSANQAAALANEVATDLNRGKRPYLGFDSNSNDAVNELTRRQIGRRVGDRQTVGWNTPLR